MVKAFGLFAVNDGNPVWLLGCSYQPVLTFAFSMVFPADVVLLVTQKGYAATAAHPSTPYSTTKTDLLYTSRFHGADVRI